MRKIPAALALSVALGVGSLGVLGAHVFAQSPQAPAASATADSVPNGVPSQTKEAKPAESSEKGEAPEVGEGKKADEAQEAARLAQEAKLTPQEAEAKALAAVPGNVGKVELGDENGRVIYEVHVQDASGKNTEVKVDAKTGEIAGKETDGEHEGGLDENYEHQD